jgi:hypothetical protein
MLFVFLFINIFLQIILALGNYMNSGQRGGAYGFKLNSILKVSRVYIL